MFKHRDNIAFAPTMSDPTGTGVILQPTAAAAVVPAAPTAAGARKRGRDIRGLDRFRSVVFGENGFRRLHAMAERNPILMYPPDGTAEARQRHLQRLQAQQEELQKNGACVVVRGPKERKFEADDEALWAMFDERRQAEVDAEEAEPHAPPQQQQGMDQSPQHDAAKDEQLATYHHKQLETLLRIVYEFNHTTFVKLPMQDTLSLLARCGKEAVAHVLEYETLLRMSREGKLRELKELKEMRDRLRERTARAREESEERALAQAERIQARLDGGSGNDEDVGGGLVEGDEDRPQPHRVSFMGVTDDVPEQEAAAPAGAAEDEGLASGPAEDVLPVTLEEDASAAVHLSSEEVATTAVEERESASADVADAPVAERPGDDE